MRLRVISEVFADGQQLVTESEQFNFSVNAGVYRVSATRFPPPPGSIDIKTLHNPALTTYKGKYTNNLSDCVSERKTLPGGIYVVIPSTFHPN